jgi:hypothetical protein
MTSSAATATARLPVSIDETIPLMERAMRLSPREPHGGNFYQQIGIVHLLQSRTDEAIRSSWSVVAFEWRSG